MILYVSTVDLGGFNIRFWWLFLIPLTPGTTQKTMLSPNTALVKKLQSSVLSNGEKKPVYLILLYTKQDLRRLMRKKRKM